MDDDLKPADWAEEQALFRLEVIGPLLPDIGNRRNLARLAEGEPGRMRSRLALPS